MPAKKRACRTTELSEKTEDIASLPEQKNWYILFYHQRVAYGKRAHRFDRPRRTCYHFPPSTMSIFSSNSANRRADLVEQARVGFIERFGHEPEAVGIAPGRVELLGNHTDYNEGFRSNRRD